MTDQEILTCINDGALTLFSILGDAPHMERTEYDSYSIISPKPGEQGTHTICNIQLEHLTDEEALRKINEVKNLGLHKWWNLDCSDRIYRLIHGHDKAPANPDDGEFSMALLPTDIPVAEKRICGAPSQKISIQKANDPQSFAQWAKIVNKICGDGTIVHPEHHYHHCASGAMDCWLGFFKGVPAAVISVLHKDNIAAVYFLGTLKRFRKKGLARALAATAIDEAFRAGAKIAVAIVWSDAKPLADSLGFRAY